jgi:pilus assembly protein Flp/PilA
MRRFLELLKDQRGATAVEYGLILAMVFLAMIAALGGVASTTTEMWNFVSEQVTNA